MTYQCLGILFAFFAAAVACIGAVRSTPITNPADVVLSRLMRKLETQSETLEKFFNEGVEHTLASRY